MNESPDSDSFNEDRETRSGLGGASSDPESFPLRETITRVGRHEIIRQLGKGGFGFVYLADDPSLQRQVAVKVPRWDKPLKEDEIERFLREGQLLAQANHPSIVTVHDVGMTDDDIPFVVMEYIEGQSLSQVIKDRSLTVDEIIVLLLRVAAALQHAHKRGLIHRDFKPSNVIIDSEQEIHLVDFGLALHDDLAPHDWGESGVAGTPQYMAPEQIRGENHLIDGQTDIWAFGVTMYLMLVGSRPFKGNGYRELSRSICYKNPRPPRQLDERIPRQLERICLRCLQKLMEERYRSMADVIDELNAYVNEDIADESRDMGIDSPSLTGLKKISEAESQSKKSGALSGSTKTESQHSDVSDRDNITLVPKGLRSFDRNDRDFFFQLLPGPTDRHGVPESIRFWTSRLDMTDQVDDVPVGLIYGPSGCGKSSFVQAGLIPSLSEHVVPIYVDCTTEQLEIRIVERIHSEINAVPLGANLSSTLRKIRQDEYLRRGDKLLLVLDQFEQWLNTCDNFAENELTEALRQCESQRIQALFLIRDEFWLSASQFLRCLEQRIEERKNAMSLPLFDERHARRVLKAFGRAYERLPSDEKQLSRQQSKFLKQAVASLAQRGKVICVHLAVFARTAKSRTWNYSDLKSVGGWEGIGLEFITGIFNDPETPGYIKQHSDEAWKILEQLLPSHESELKGNAVEKRNLMAGAGLVDHPARFDELMHFLEFEANLISPVEDSDAIDEESPKSTESSRHESLYGLTHDFLVKPIRKWGTVKQNETRRGRAESLMTNLADQWSMTQDDRFMPSVWDFLRMSFLTSQGTKSQHRDYWKAATRRATRQFAIVGVLLLIGLIAGGLVRSSKAQSDAMYAANQFLNCESLEVEAKRLEMEPVFSKVEKELREATQSPVLKRRLRANAALLARYPNDDQFYEGLLNEIGEIDAGEFQTVLYPFNKSKENSLAQLRKRFDREDGALTKARVAILCAYLGDASMLAENFRLVGNPEYRTSSIDQVPKWRGNLGNILEHCLDVQQLEQGDLLSGICCGLSLVEKGSVTETEKNRCIEFFNQVFKMSPHGGAHSAAQFAMTKWNVPIPDVVNLNIPNGQWMEVHIPNLAKPGTTHRILLVEIPKGSYVVGSGVNDFRQHSPANHTGKIERPFWISAYEIPQAIYDDFATAKTALSEIESENPFSVIPVSGISQPQAVSFLDWLTKRDDLRCTDNRIIFCQNDERTHRFKLPTSDQFEFANRAFSETTFFFGNDFSLLALFTGRGVQFNDSRSNQFMPNGFGVFDMISNLEEWVHEVDEEPNGFGCVKGGYDGCKASQLPSAFTLIYGKIGKSSKRGFRLVFDQPTM